MDPNIKKRLTRAIRSRNTDTIRCILVDSKFDYESLKNFVEERVVEWDHRLIILFYRCLVDRKDGMEWIMFRVYMSALEWDKINIVREFLKADIYPIDTYDHVSEKTIIQTAAYSRSKIFLMFLDRIPVGDTRLINETHQDGSSLLTMAARQMEYESVRALIKRGANVNSSLYRQYNTLDNICRTCKMITSEILETVQLLVDAGSIISQTLFVHCLAENRIQFLEIFINAGFDIEVSYSSTTFFKYDTIVEYVMCIGCIPSLKLLLDRGAVKPSFEKNVNQILSYAFADVERFLKTYQRPLWFPENHMKITRPSERLQVLELLKIWYSQIGSFGFNILSIELVHFIIFNLIS